MVARRMVSKAGRAELRSSTSHIEGGAAAVEAALVTPFFLLLIFGIMESGAAVMNWNAIHGASREAARAASVGGTSESTDYDLLQEVTGRLRTSIADLRYVIVFKAADTQAEPPSGCVAAAESGGAGVTNLCNVYRTADFTKPPAAFSNGTAFQADNNWPALDRIDWMNGPVDLVGVHLATRHSSLTGIVPKVTLRYTTVFAIEAATEDGDV